MKYLIIALIFVTACSSKQKDDSVNIDDSNSHDTSSENTDGGADSDTNSDAGVADSDADSNSTTDGTAADDSDSDTTPVTYEYELVQSLADVDTPVSEMVVYRDTIFFIFAGIAALCRMDVNGEQVYDCMPESIDDLAIFGDRLWWDYGGGAADFLPETNEIQYISLGTYSDSSFDFTIDADGMFFANHGCKNVVGMNHDGEIILDENLVFEGQAAYLPYVTTSVTHVYCSGSSSVEFTAGKVFRVPKTGGEIVEVTSAPTTIENNNLHSTGPMKIVDDTLYYFHFYTGGADVGPLWLLSAPAEGGESRIVFDAKEYAGYSSPLVYDEKKRAFYFTIDYSLLLYKYEIESGEINTTPIEYEPQGQVAFDDAYIYWYMDKGIYRMEKF